MEPTGWAALAAAFAACVLAVWGLRTWSTGADRQHELVERLTTAEGAGATGRRDRIGALDRRLRRTRSGRALERRIAVSGLPVTPGRFLLAVLAALVLAWLAAASLLAPFFGPVAALAVLWAASAFLAWRRQKRIERFIGQLPDLARLLANSAAAGLALRTSLGLAADELDAPAGEELTRVADALAVGRSLDEALGDLKERLPSRELAVLVTTLVLSSKAGGALVDSLRNLTETLEDRKETRREVRTTLSQITITAYAVPGIGLGALLMLNKMSPGSLTAMTGTFLGQAAVVTALVLYATGFVLIRRMARIDV
jgi:tight adherence protein B